MKIYTKTGDKGVTSLYDGKKMSKRNILFHILGEIDELSSRIGLLSNIIKSNIESSLYKNKINLLEQLKKIQKKLQDINSNIATVDKKGRILPEILEEDTLDLEMLIDIMDNMNSRLTVFILPGASIEDSYCHLCRTQTRKVERYLLELQETDEIVCYKKGKKELYLDLSLLNVDNNVLTFINRLSDFFFCLCRWLCTIRNIPDNIIE